MNMPLRKPLVTSWPVTADGHPATLVAALARNAAETGSRAAFRERDRGVWQERNWAETFAEVMALRGCARSARARSRSGADGDRRQPHAPLQCDACGDGAARVSIAGLSRCSA